MPRLRPRLPCTAHLACFVTLVALLAGLPAARAESARDQARGLFLQARDLYNHKDYSAALTRFRQASKLYSSYKIELSIGFALEKLGRLVEAAPYLERFLIDASRPPDNAVEDQVLGQLERIRREVASVSLRADLRGAVVVVDGRARYATPLKHRIYVAPGRHRISVERAGQRLYARRVTLRAGQHFKIKRPGKPTRGAADRTRGEAWLTEQRPAPRTSASPYYKTWWFWTAVGVVVVGATVGLAVGAEGGDDWRPSGDSGTIDLRP
jgi:hypothetical protein